MDLNTAFPEQRIAGLRPANPERRNPGLRTVFLEQRNCSGHGCSSAGHSPSNASQAYGLLTPSDTIPAFGRLSPSNASQAYGLHTPSDAIAT